MYHARSYEKRVARAEWHALRAVTEPTVSTHDNVNLILRMRLLLVNAPRSVVFKSHTAVREQQRREVTWRQRCSLGVLEGNLRSLRLRTHRATLMV